MLRQPRKTLYTSYISSVIMHKKVLLKTTNYDLWVSCWNTSVSLLHVCLPSTMESIFSQTGTDETVVLSAWQSAWISSRFPRFFIIQTSFLILNSSSIVHHHPQMLASIPWIINTLTILAKVATGTRSSACDATPHITNYISRPALSCWNQWDKSHWSDWFVSFYLCR